MNKVWLIYVNLVLNQFWKFEECFDVLIKFERFRLISQPSGPPRPLQLVVCHVWDSRYLVYPRTIPCRIEILRCASTLSSKTILADSSLSVHCYTRNTENRIFLLPPSYSASSTPGDRTKRADSPPGQEQLCTAFLKRMSSKCQEATVTTAKTSPESVNATYPNDPNALLFASVRCENDSTRILFGSTLCCDDFSSTRHLGNTELLYHEAGTKQRARLHLPRPEVLRILTVAYMGIWVANVFDRCRVKK